MGAACVAVAYSGGRDSTALLYATARAAQDLPGVRVVALHVHHGLSTQADAWLSHAQESCERWASEGLPVSLVHCCVQVELRRGDSVESRARDLRYEALQAMAHEVGADMLLLAHHRRDQAETFLLQALRGAGVAGLAGMPVDEVRGGVRWVRPWLNRARQDIEAYLAAHGLTFIDDDSNSNPRFARNRLRLSVWPALLQAFPDAEGALAAASRRVADVLPITRQWCEQTLADLSGAPNEALGEIGPRSVLDAQKWGCLPAYARRETLRHWYRESTGGSLSASWIERLSAEVPGLLERETPVHWPEIGVSLYRGCLSLGDMLPVRRVGRQPEVVSWPGALGPGAWHVSGWLGTLVVTAASAGGVRPELLSDVVLRPRLGGEQFQLGPRRPPRSLKKQYQALGVPPWQRQGPLIYAGEQLVFVPGLGIDARCRAPDGVVQYQLGWLPHASRIE